MNLSKRLDTMTPSFTIGISSKVKEMNSNGIDVLNLSIGEPDFTVPEKAKAYGKKSLDENCTKYDLVPGLKILREEIVKKLKKENNCDYSIDEIVVSSGAKNSITNALLAITNPGEEVLIPKPYWVSYPEMVKLTGGIPKFIDTKRENGFKLSKEELLNAISDNSKMLILTNPSNPTGNVYTKSELEEIVDVCYEKGIFILADEIYERICYVDGFTSVASLSEKAKEITITINGFAKSVAMTGLRLGYTASNREVAKAMSSIQGHLVSHPSLTAQYIGYGALVECEDDIKHMVSVYRSRRDILIERLDNIEHVSYIQPFGAFYMFIDLSDVSKKYNWEKSFSIEFCEEFLNKYHVAVVPGIAFGLDDYIRISYACDEDTLINATNKLEEFIDDIFN
ncbi:pyridoxal phosphate-dependent aminotransferase [Peptacetobacter sp.]|uniref:pyridoxal phosphate-dependent aminotransferase n=1 Tax=Peptacetobacter sp. TaxID=2991975 RepID=UPI0026025DC6|nr:pyridoxal phosphate-dependent aminotransferase [Peptacetobacter sp.]